jgi:ATP-binding cassette subfamily B protein
MIKIFKYLKWKEWLLTSGCIAFIVAQVFLDLKLPDYMSEITRLVQTPGGSVGDLLAPGGFMLLCAIGSLIAAIITGFLAAKVATSFAAELRQNVFDRTLAFSMQEIDRFSISSLITRTTNDITKLQMFVALGLPMIIQGPIWLVTIWGLYQFRSGYQTQGMD